MIFAFVYPRLDFPVPEPVSRVSRATVVLAATGALISPAAAGEVTLALERIEAAGFALGSVTARLAPEALLLDVGELSVRGHTWRNVRASCAKFRLSGATIECREGELEIGGEKIALAFSYAGAQQALDAVLRPAPGEVWRLRARFGARAPEARVEIVNGDLRRAAAWLPAHWPRVTAGAVSGTIHLAGPGYGRLESRLAVRGAAFSDASGLRAAEKLDLVAEIGARRSGAAWRYSAALEWTGGELYWQPLYLRGEGHALEAEGALDEARLAVSRARVRLAGVGEAAASAEWDRGAGALISADARAARLDAAALYEQILKPFLFGTALGDLRAEGSLEGAARWRESRLEALDIAVRDLSFEDRNRRFAVFGASGRIPWHRTEQTRLDLVMKGGELLRVPIGPVRLPLAMRGMRFRLETVEVPLLDGTLTVRGFATEPPEEGWRWSFRGSLSPVSMERFTQAVGLPTMHGTVSADIPRVAYSGSTLRVDGALEFRMFDGTVTADNLTLIEPFGRAPRLAADLDAHGIDLELLTRAFSFGTITGRVDASVKGLELANWRPVKFDARLESSPGSYPRTISQRAVENIAALGGAGAAGVIQGTFLRFFERFRYRRLGLSCRLEFGVCRMGGIEDAPQGYVIVSGGGVPALSVLGYNRAVDWNELIERLRRIVQENAPVVVE